MKEKKRIETAAVCLLFLCAFVSSELNARDTEYQITASTLRMSAEVRGVEGKGPFEFLPETHRALDWPGHFTSRYPVTYGDYETAAVLDVNSGTASAIVVQGQKQLQGWFTVTLYAIIQDLQLAQSEPTPAAGINAEGVAELSSGVELNGKIGYRIWVERTEEDGSKTLLRDTGGEEMLFSLGKNNPFFLRTNPFQNVETGQALQGTMWLWKGIEEIFLPFGETWPVLGNGIYLNMSVALDGATSVPDFPTVHVVAPAGDIRVPAETNNYTVQAVTVDADASFPDIELKLRIPGRDATWRSMSRSGPQDGVSTWTLNVDLVPGENVIEISALDQGVPFSLASRTIWRTRLPQLSIFSPAGDIQVLPLTTSYLVGAVSIDADRVFPDLEVKLRIPEKDTAWQMMSRSGPIDGVSVWTLDAGLISGQNTVEVCAVDGGTTLALASRIIQRPRPPELSIFLPSSDIRVPSGTTSQRVRAVAQDPDRAFPNMRLRIRSVETGLASQVMNLLSAANGVSTWTLVMGLNPGVNTFEVSAMEQGVPLGVAAFRIIRRNYLPQAELVKVIYTPDPRESWPTGVSLSGSASDADEEDDVRIRMDYQSSGGIVLHPASGGVLLEMNGSSSLVFSPDYDRKWARDLSWEYPNGPTSGSIAVQLFVKDDYENEWRLFDALTYPLDTNTSTRNWQLYE